MTSLDHTCAVACGAHTPSRRIKAQAPSVVPAGGLITAGPALDQRPETHATEATATDTPWQVVVWDDPVNLMSWVTWVFRTYFGFSQAKAHRLMLEVHTNGRAVVASGSLEQAEQHVAALHGFGLWATYERAGGSSNGSQTPGGGA